MTVYKLGISPQKGAYGQPAVKTQARGVSEESTPATTVH